MGRNTNKKKAQNLAKARAAMVAKRAATEDASAKVGLNPSWWFIDVGSR